MRKNLPLIALIFFIILTITGVLLGEPKDVFHKAITLCLSCIGIG